MYKFNVAGGMSDRGYSSMTLDDAKRASIIIGSQDSLDSLSKQNSNKVEKRDHPRPISRISLRKERSKSDGVANEKGIYFQVLFGKHNGCQYCDSTL